MLGHTDACDGLVPKALDGDAGEYRDEERGNAPGHDKDKRRQKTVYVAADREDALVLKQESRLDGGNGGAVHDNRDVKDLSGRGGSCQSAHITDSGLA